GGLRPYFRTEPPKVIRQAKPAPAIDLADASELSDDVGQTPQDAAIDPTAPSALADNSIAPSIAPDLSGGDEIKVAASAVP
ncbi:MAG: hypothetical protein OXC60_10045, partial [Litoreibacter sp.]|nr:hypothetical protein [Litoreibacter sp.]